MFRYNHSLNRHLLLKHIPKTSESAIYRTLHSYKLFWAVCHLFPQRWQTLTYSVSGNHWPGGPRDMFKTRSARKFKSCVFEPPTRRVFSINTSSSNTLFLFQHISPQQQHHEWASQTFIYKDYETLSRLWETACF